MLADLLLISACYLVTWLMFNGRISLKQFLPTLLAGWGIFVFIFFIAFWLLKGNFYKLKEMGASGGREPCERLDAGIFRAGAKNPSDRFYR